MSVNRDTEKLLDSEVLGDPNADAIASLQDQLEAAKNDLNEERFLWMLGLIAMTDAYMFSHMESWSGPIVIGIVELIAVAVMARKWQIEEIPQLLAKALDRIPQK